jgi:recombinational DNA repair protein (RecF pathway)
MSNICDLCGQLEDERALQIYRNGWLCLDCSSYYSDEELIERGFIFENTKEEELNK